MTTVDAKVHERARRAHGLVTRETVLGCGGDDHLITRRRDAGRWLRAQPGVYLVGLGPPTWLQALHAACLAVGPGAAVSHRAAAILWGLDGVAGGIVEVTIPFTTTVVLEGAVVHRSRRPPERDASERNGVPVTSVERTLLDLGRYVGPTGVEIALESALRQRLTTTTRVFDHLASPHSRGRPGAGRLRRVLSMREPGRVAGSAAEVRLIRCLREHGLPAPVRQHPVKLRNGAVAVVDLAWPDRKLAVEWDGYDFHSGRRAFAADLDRQNALFDVGWDLRRYTGDAVRRQPERIVATLARLLCAKTAA